MTKPRHALLACLLLSLTALAPAAIRAAPPQAGPLVPGWNAFADRLRELAPKALGKLPDRLREDPQVQQEVGRLMLEALAAGTTQAITADGDHPMFYPSLNFLLNVFQPNADTIYRNADIAPGGSYRLRGRAGTTRMALIGTFGAANAGPGAVNASAYYDLNSLKTDADGRYDVLLSPVKPAGYAGDWWRLDPGTSRLLLRLVAQDWSKERDPTISIERVDVPAPRPRPPAHLLEQRLADLPASVERQALFLIDHVEGLRRDGFVNKLRQWDVVAGFGGVFGQFYYEGAFELKDDEVLLLETQMPQGCLYASLLLTNDIFETIDWYNNHSSLNAAQWQIGRDGTLRVVISAKDPGVQNWLDTAGHATGVVQGRWTGCSATPIPSARKVALKDLPKLLPADTAKLSPADRDRILRDRRSAFQQRPLW